MGLKISVIGSTGLIGKTFLESIKEGDYDQVTAITRREIENLKGKTFIKQACYDFSNLEQMKPDLKADVLICALGTTIKIAGSQERFIEVDHDLPLEIAKLAVSEGCQTIVLISAVGADVDSSIFYSRIKGRLEQDISTLPVRGIHILRPSMLMGERLESRPGEFVGKIIMQPLRFLIPWKYKPVHASTIVETIHNVIREGKQGQHFYEGKRLFGQK
ncbi:NAD-dependent epimerase/dehydratase family protein [bacterium]|nr:NAD-dependent epimerase/dehydratase family protein [bacterium]